MCSVRHELIDLAGERTLEHLRLASEMSRRMHGGDGERRTHLWLTYDRRPDHAVAALSKLRLVAAEGAVQRRRRHAAAVTPFTPALEGCIEDLRGLRVSAVAGAVAALLGDVLELADHPIDLVIGHAPDQRGGEDACDVDSLVSMGGGSRRPERT